MSTYYTFKYTNNHLITSMERYRQQLWWRRPFIVYRWPIVITCLVSLPVSFHFHLKIVFILTGAALGALLLGWPIDKWNTKHRFKKSPYYNDELVITLSDDGFQAKGTNNEVKLNWNAFTKAVRFSDGVMLFQGPHVFNWLPDDSAENPDTINETLVLIRKKITGFKSL